MRIVSRGNFSGRVLHTPWDGLVPTPRSWNDVIPEGPWEDLWHGCRFVDLRNRAEQWWVFHAPRSGHDGIMREGDVRVPLRDLTTLNGPQSVVSALCATCVKVTFRGVFHEKTW